jgi:CheY-like chemotaxis protein
MVACTFGVTTNMNIFRFMRLACAVGSSFGLGGHGMAVVAGNGGGLGGLGGRVGFGKSILVIEDDAAIRDAVSLVLQDEGYSVTGVANGQEALQHLRRTAPPNLILLDLMMPVMNGWEFRTQQAQDPALQSIPVVVVSGHPGIPQKAAALGATEYLIKPIDVDELLEAVRRCCQSRI